ncbi:MAG TPA: hypothetical protein VEA44_04700 [Caulobacter sp.]|nr:hypothetical protein [Caulobacter sp.]
MKTLAAAAALFVAVSATAAAAQSDARLTDAQFVKAARCKGLAKSAALGAIDTSALDAVIKANKRARADFVIDRAMNAQDEAQSEANRADDARKAELIAERNGACAAFAS